MPGKPENQFGRVTRHAVAQALLTGCMGKSLQFVAGLLQGKEAACSARFPTSERVIVDHAFLTREQTAKLSSHCQECRKALNDAAIAWKQRDRRQLNSSVKEFREAQRKMRQEIIATAS